MGPEALCFRVVRPSVCMCLCLCASVHSRRSISYRLLAVFCFRCLSMFHCLHPLQVKIAILGTGGADEVQFPEAGLRFPVGI